MLFVRRCCLTLKLMRGITVRNKSHYDSLGVSPSATQADIKTAYYELSKQYHPDTNKGSEESLNRFRQVTDAYEILGNVKTRRLYDRGLVVGSSGTTIRRDDEPDDPNTKFYKQREKRTKVPTTPGRATVYDFDAWSKAHYSKNAQRKNSARDLYEFCKSAQLEHDHKMQVYRTSIAGIILITLVLYMTEKLFGEDLDKVTGKEKQTNIGNVR